MAYFEPIFDFTALCLSFFVKLTGSYLCSQPCIFRLSPLLQQDFAGFTSFSRACFLFAGFQIASQQRRRDF
jgi:hypothetical protein